MNKIYLPLFTCMLLLAAFRAIQAPAVPAGDRPDTTAPAYLKAKDYKGKSVVSTSGVISFTTGLDNDFYPADSVNRTGDLYLEVQLAKLLNLPTKRTPLNISIVIDRSGSMAGVKMGYAKKAAKSIIDRLQPEDFVSVVMYDNAIDSVQEPIAAINKEPIKARIDKIAPRGSTNLWGGTEKGYEYVKRNYRSGFINRVLLISDGLANVGLTDSAQIMRNVQKFKDDEGITLSTFGVGLDYNETLMTTMAETGAGNYYFIDAPDRIMKLFDRELSGMLNVVAQDALLQINLPPGVRILKAYPLQYAQHANTVTISLRDLFAEDIKSAWLHFGVENKIAAPLHFTATLSYTDILDGQKKQAVNQNLLSPVKLTDAYLTHFNKPVIEQVIFFTANENLERAMSQVDRGEFDAAKTSLSANRRYLRAHAYFVNGSRALQSTDSMNTHYNLAAAQASQMQADSLKKLQKFSRKANYELRNKKQ